MIKTTRLITALIIMLSASQLFAEPKSKSNCCQPSPVGGMEMLEQNTFYPILLKEAGVESDVILSFDVDVFGNVSNINVSHSGGTMFDKSAIMAVMDTQWSPAMQNGQPVAVTFEIPFQFRSL